MTELELKKFQKPYTQILKWIDYIALNGEKYFLSLIDDFSNATEVNVINKTGKKIKKLRCDNGILNLVHHISMN